MVPEALFKKFQILQFIASVEVSNEAKIRNQFIASVEVSNIARCSSKLDELRNI